MASKKELVTCRVCNRTDGKFIRPCACANDLANVHKECLQEHMKTAGIEKCDRCNTKYKGLKIYKQPTGFGTYVAQDGRWLSVFVQFPITAGFFFYLIYMGGMQIALSSGDHLWFVTLLALVIFFALLFLAALAGSIMAFQSSYKQWQTKNPYIVTITEVPQNRLTICSCLCCRSIILRMLVEKHKMWKMMAKKSLIYCFCSLLWSHFRISKIRRSHFRRLFVRLA